jgi:hypothetical protein
MSTISVLLRAMLIPWESGELGVKLTPRTPVVAEVEVPVQLCTNRPEELWALRRAMSTTSDVSKRLSVSDAYYASLTSAQLNATFYSPTEGTHFSESGATQIGGLVAKNLKASTVPIRAFLK